MLNPINVKILIGYHQLVKTIKKDFFVPIYLGHASLEKSEKLEKELLLSNSLVDDYGDNLSLENSQICELTAHYWAWKNLDKLNYPDYVGFCHYRRYFIFNDSEYENQNKQYVFNNIYELESEIEGKFDFERYDCYIPYVEDVKSRGYISIIDQFEKRHSDYSHDLTNVIHFIKCSFPEYNELLKEYFYGTKGYFYNMFIMKTEYFIEYSKFLFTVKNFISSFAKEPRRAAFILERITGFYLYVMTKSLKVKELPIAFIKNTQYIEPIAPIFSEDAIVVTFCTDNNYLPNTAVAIQSLIKNLNPDRKLDIVIISEEVSEMYKSMLERLRSSKVSIRFYKAPLIGDNFFYTHKHFSKVTYYRFFIGEIFKNYTKVLYLDGDVIVNRDISDLYDISLNNYLLGVSVAIGPQYAFRKNNPLKTLNTNMQDYWYNILNIHDPSNYFNAGMLLINIQEFNKQNIISKLFKKVKFIKNPPGVDQDLLNAVCQGKVKVISNAYNFIDHSSKRDLSNYLSSEIYNDYLIASKNPAIIHYADIYKPWNDFRCPRASLWWTYAKLSPFYEIILFKFIMNHKQNKKPINKQPVVSNKKLNLVIYKYLSYRILREITFGELKDKFKKKCKKYKDILLSGNYE